MKPFKQPMLAKDYDESSLEFPCWLSPKIDGYRCLTLNEIANTRSGKPFRNKFVQSIIGHAALEELDGELVVGERSSPDVFNRSSAVMKTDGEPDFTFIVFDYFGNPDMEFESRAALAEAKVKEFGNARVAFLPQILVHSLEEFDAAEAHFLSLGYEGMMKRKPKSPYKHGRSTVKEGYLLKVKRFAHEEGVVVSGEELMHNDNEAYINEVGKTKRSDAKDGLRPSSMLGAYIVHNPKYAKNFKVSCGSMSHAERKLALQMLAGDLGRTIRYKFLPHGTKDVPRHGLYAGFRDESDLLPPGSD